MKEKTGTRRIHHEKIEREEDKEREKKKEGDPQLINEMLPIKNIWEVRKKN